MHQSIMKKMKNFATEDWSLIKAIVKHSIMNFEC